MKKNIEEIACEIGTKMIENGAEISRAEDTIKRIIYSDDKECSVFCISSLVIVSTKETVLVRRVKSVDLNLFEIDRLNTLSRDICNNTHTKICNNQYNIFTQILSTILATGAFCIYFGGTITDALISGIIGIIISFLPSAKGSLFSKTLAQSVLAGLLAFIPLKVGAPCNPDKIMIGTIMLLIPGITIGNSIRDIMYSDTLSGIIELTESLFYAFAIAVGFAVGVMIFGY